MINSVVYAGPAKQMFNSNLKCKLPKKYHEDFAVINGIVSFGITNDEYKDFQVYSSQAEYLDGVERICHIETVVDKKGNIFLKIRESKTSRGDRYSALFFELSKKMDAMGFFNQNSCYFVGIEDLKKLISLINEVISERSLQKYSLKLTARIERIKVKGQYYFYNAVVWEPYNHDFIADVEMAIRNTEEIENLKKIHVQLKRVEDICEKKITYLESIS